MVMLQGQERVLALVTSRELLLKLFTNDITPAAGDTANRYVEPRYGYTHKTLSPTHWHPAPNGMMYPEQTFTFSEKIGDVYGAFLVFKNTGELLGVERFGEHPIMIPTSAHKLIVSVYLH